MYLVVVKQSPSLQNCWQGCQKPQNAAKSWNLTIQAKKHGKLWNSINLEKNWNFEQKSSKNPEKPGIKENLHVK